MFSIKKLYFEPNSLSGNTIEPVLFDSGINIILGEKSESSENVEERKKMNGVGKSMLIESINFCLLKDLKDSRINKIPLVTLGPDVYVCLDIEVESDSAIQQITIKRTRNESAKILIIEDGVEKEFDNLQSARQYLESLILPKTVGSRPSLRSLISILIRDEQASYKDVLEPYPNSNTYKYSDLLKPHLYLFGIDVSILDKVKNILSESDKLSKSISLINKDFKQEGIPAREIRAYLNELEDNVGKLNLAVDALQPQEGINQIQEELTSLLSRLSQLNIDRSAKIFVSKQIKQLPKPEKIPVKEVRILYNQFQKGLGDLVEKSLDQVLEFKKEVENFQYELMNQKLRQLTAEIDSLNQEIEKIDKRIGELYKLTDAKKRISDLAETIRLQKEKNEKYELLKFKYQSREEQDQQKKHLKKKMDQQVERLRAEIFNVSDAIVSFEDDLKNAHQFIAGNKNCQFELKIDESKARYLKLDYRIKLDGSSGINRIRTFIYDVLLMVNSFTSKRHPRLLVHDNIFASTGKDDMIKALNFLYLQEQSGKEFQYILTINKDEFEGNIDELNFDYTNKVKKTLTREKPFFSTVYLED